MAGRYIHKRTRVNAGVEEEDKRIKKYYKKTALELVDDDAAVPRSPAAPAAAADSVDRDLALQCLDEAERNISARRRSATAASSSTNPRAAGAKKTKPTPVGIPKKAAVSAIPPPHDGDSRSPVMHECGMDAAVLSSSTGGEPSVQAMGDSTLAHRNCSPLSPAEVEALRRKILVPPRRNATGHPMIREFPRIRYLIRRATCGADLSRAVKDMNAIFPDWPCFVIESNPELVYTAAELHDSDLWRELERTGQISYTVQVVTERDGDIVESHSELKVETLPDGMTWSEFIVKTAEERKELDKRFPEIRRELKKRLDKTGVPELHKELSIVLAQLAASQRTAEKFTAHYSHLPANLLPNLPNFEELVCLFRMMKRGHGEGDEKHAGINEAELISAPDTSLFPKHIEDGALASVNILLWADGPGCKKVIYAVAAQYARIVDRVIRRILRDFFRKQNPNMTAAEFEAFLKKNLCERIILGHHHKSVMLLILECLEEEEEDVPVYCLEMEPGMAVFFAPGTLHWGGQVGANTAVALNFADPDNYCRQVRGDNKYVQCEDDKVNMRKKSTKFPYGFDDVVFPLRMAATGRGWEEKKESEKDFPWYATMKNAPKVILPRHYVEDPELAKKLQETPAPTIALAKKHLYTGWLTAEQIVAQSNNPILRGVRQPEPIYDHKMFRRMMENEETESGVGWMMLVVVFSDIQDREQLVQLLLEGKVNVFLVDGVQRFTVGTMPGLDFERFLGTVYLNPDRDDIVHLLTYHCRKHHHDVLAPTGLEGVVILREIFQRVVTEYVSKFSTFKPDQFYTLYGPDLQTNVENPFRQTLLVEVCRAFPEFQILLDKNGEKMNAKLHEKRTAQFCAMRKIGQLPEECMASLETLYLKDEKELRKIGFNPDTSEELQYLGKYVTPWKLADIVPKILTFKRRKELFHTKDEFFGFVSFIIGCLVRTQNPLTKKYVKDNWETILLPEWRAQMQVEEASMLISEEEEEELEEADNDETQEQKNGSEADNDSSADEADNDETQERKNDSEADNDHNDSGADKVTEEQETGSDGDQNEVERDEASSETSEEEDDDVDEDDNVVEAMIQADDRDASPAPLSEPEKKKRRNRGRGKKGATTNSVAVRTLRSAATTGSAVQEASVDTDPDVMILDDDETNSVNVQRRQTLRWLGQNLPFTVDIRLLNPDPPKTVKASECLTLLDHTTAEITAKEEALKSVLMTTKSSIVGTFWLLRHRSHLPEIVRVLVFPDSDSARADIETFGPFNEARLTYSVEEGVNGKLRELSRGQPLMNGLIPADCTNSFTLTKDQAEKIRELCDRSFKYAPDRFHLVQQDVTAVWVGKPPGKELVVAALNAVRKLLKDPRKRNDEDSDLRKALKKVLTHQHAGVVIQLRSAVHVPDVPLAAGDQQIPSPAFYSAFQRYFEIHDVEPNGHCLFEAVSQALFNDQQYYLHMRLAAIYMFVMHFKEFLPHVATAYEDANVQLMDVIFHTACTKDRTPVQKEWGDGLHLLALATCLRRAICMYRGFHDDVNPKPANWDKKLSDKQVKKRLKEISVEGCAHITYGPLFGTASGAIIHPIRVMFTSNHYLAVMPRTAAVMNDFLPAITYTPLDH
ncbi:uncharacterized protein LOC129602207 [Paramacrobiotus metropolitanus]|uniref:uncharacterized protein LOC129602207 n=1 Tax=Paramacrobiotus metropolitanus TaxID=2943436 RepID=UPI00244648E1|nr:uncharacterized protein LOC129602207 [Paramacrobiotus metropolitanus]XP_055357163.1 uncharacterized protein LOC129602207 [Paramacrobiotus metropolitanus]XP_055357164.1 uncharacterized protein LOC129602207 [Paramacrobiotus metropolitanus]XP_055357165.1 uncharacterized protein LOC129602207 [Paramacrobiotus metropolitanus]XP_055357166.1 uncharacterized protein LOC129602207 [Paramacrobiotus metropolitanus]XP_055357167.1 uncharacterized protein LOC129602207 [Paramacrobiotus metropolitanus]